MIKVGHQSINGFQSQLIVDDVCRGAPCGGLSGSGAAATGRRRRASNGQHRVRVLIADQAFDSDPLPDELNGRGARSLQIAVNRPRRRNPSRHRIPRLEMNVCEP